MIRDRKLIEVMSSSIPVGMTVYGSTLASPHTMEVVPEL